MSGRRFAAHVRAVPLSDSCGFSSGFKFSGRYMSWSGRSWRSIGFLVSNGADTELPASPKIVTRKLQPAQGARGASHPVFRYQNGVLLVQDAGRRHASSRSSGSDHLPSKPQKPVKPRRPIPSAVADQLKSHPYEANRLGDTPQAASEPGFWSVRSSSSESAAQGSTVPATALNPLPSASTKTVYYAFFGNTAILLLKCAMWLKSGSSAMMAETLHTFADTLNQALLIRGVRQSSIAPDRVHQYGYGRAAFFWGLVSALGLFWCGAGVTVFHGVSPNCFFFMRHRHELCLFSFSVYHAGIEKLIHPPETLVVDTDVWTVLGASLLIDGAVLVRATSELLARAQANDASLRSLGDKASVITKMRAIYLHLRKTQVCVARLAECRSWTMMDSHEFSGSVHHGCIFGGFRRVFGCLYRWCWHRVDASDGVRLAWGFMTLTIPAFYLMCGVRCGV
jgi:hypothetical protein